MKTDDKNEGDKEDKEDEVINTKMKIDKEDEVEEVEDKVDEDKVDENEEDEGEELSTPAWYFINLEPAVSP